MLQIFDATTNLPVEPGTVVQHITTRAKYEVVRALRPATEYTTGVVEVPGNEFSAYSLGLVVRDV